MTYSKIIATGSYLPKRTMPNVEFESIVETSDQWIVERTGIKNRHIVAESETAADMGAAALEAALVRSNIDKTRLDLIIVATCTPDRAFPSTACLIQKKLALKDFPAFDISAACTGFIYALNLADQMIKSGQVKYAAVIGAEVMSSIIDWTERQTCVLFGDGAGAVILAAVDKPGILAHKISANGEFEKKLYVSNPHDLNYGATPYIQMKGNDVFKVAVAVLGKIADEILIENGIDKSDIDWLVPHQANLRIIKATAKRLKLPLEQVILTVQEHGNTSSASIPLALDQGVRDGRIKPGQLILMEAFGGGFTWGASLVKL